LLVLLWLVAVKVAWQVILVDFDNRTRSRRLAVQVVDEHIQWKVVLAVCVSWQRENRVS
jgi:hypothetical protein